MQDKRRKSLTSVFYTVHMAVCDFGRNKRNCCRRAGWVQMISCCWNNWIGGDYTGNGAYAVLCVGVIAVLLQPGLKLSTEGIGEGRSDCAPCLTHPLFLVYVGVLSTFVPLCPVAHLTLLELWVKRLITLAVSNWLGSLEFRLIALHLWISEMYKLQ